MTFLYHSEHAQSLTERLLINQQRHKHLSIQMQQRAIYQRHQQKALQHHDRVSIIINAITQGNYLFASYAPKNTPLELIEGLVGSTLYIPVMFAIVILIWVLQLLPFYKRRTHA